MTEETLEEYIESIEQSEVLSAQEPKFYRHKHATLYVAKNTAKITLYEWEDESGEMVFKVEIQSGATTLTFVPDEWDLDSLSSMFSGKIY